MSPSNPDAVYAALRDADPDAMDRDELAVVAKQIAQHASWLDSVKVQVDSPAACARRRGPGRGSQGSVGSRGRPVGPRRSHRRRPREGLHCAAELRRRSRRVVRCRLVTSTRSHRRSVAWTR